MHRRKPNKNKRDKIKEKISRINNKKKKKLSSRSLVNVDKIY